MTYSRFALMILTSTVIMFGLMYLNTYAFEHVFYSETRVYMAIVMGATMAFVMLAFMASMYPSRAVNIAIFAGSIVVFAGAIHREEHHQVISIDRALAADNLDRIRECHPVILKRRFFP